MLVMKNVFLEYIVVFELVTRHRLFYQVHAIKVYIIGNADMLNIWDFCKQGNYPNFVDIQTQFPSY